MDVWLITGGAGFIGSNFVRRALAVSTARLVVLDKLTYAGSLDNLGEAVDDPRLTFVRGDIGDRGLVAELFREHRPAIVVDFAAETHVDRSIDGPRAFLETNVAGCFELLEAARRHVAELADAERDAFRFLHVSTDEVYGALGAEGSFTEASPYAPSSPYAASKAAADQFVRAYHRTFGLPALVTNCSNNYGPRQFPEKLVPLAILNAIEARAIPIYGDGGHVRDWIHVDDHVDGILAVLAQGRPGETYAIGGGGERTNLAMVDAICDAVEEALPAAANDAMRAAGRSSYRDLKTFVAERSGHDRRYAIDATKARVELGWSPRRTLEEGMRETVRWYLAHRDWARAMQERARYGRERLGLGRNTEGDR